MYYYGIAMAIIIGAFLLLKGFGVDTAVKKSYKWIHEYSPPPLPKQIANYTTIAGILCVIISLYLGFQYTTSNLRATVDVVVGISQIPAWFIKGTADLLIIGTIIILAGRSITFYFEKDTRLLRNVALIAEVAWIRVIMQTTVNLLLQTELTIGFQNSFFQNFVASIVIGILIGIAAILLITVMGKSTSKFFKKSDENEDKQTDNITAPIEAIL